MDWWNIADIILFFCFVPSVIVYVIFLIAIVKFRKRYPFNSTYFILAFALGIFDIIGLLRNWLLRRCPYYGIFAMDRLVARWPHIIGRISKTRLWHTIYVQGHLLFVISLNRLTSILWPLKYDRYWPKKRTLKIVAMVIIIAVGFITPMFTFELSYGINNNSGKVQFKISQERYMAMVYYYVYAVVFIAAGTILTAVIYSVLFWKVHLLNKVTPLSGQIKTELKYAIIGFFLCTHYILTALFCIFIIVSADPGDTSARSRALFVYFTLGDIFYWENLWLTLILSKNVRNHVIVLITRKNVAKLDEKIAIELINNKAPGINRSRRMLNKDQRKLAWAPPPVEFQ